MTNPPSSAPSVKTRISTHVSSYDRTTAIIDVTPIQKLFNPVVALATLVYAPIKN